MKQNIAILFGGPSVEHDVSVITAMQVLKNIDTDRYHVAPLYWAKDGSFYSMDVTESFEELAKRIKSHPVRVSFSHKTIHYKAPGVLFSRSDFHPDVVLPCFHGTGGEDGVIQGLLEVMDVPYIGSGVSASAIGMDKALFKAVMHEHKLPVLDYTVVTKQDGLDVKKLPFDFPIIAKPTHLGSSIGVAHCDNIKEVHEALEVIYALDSHAMLEPYIAEKIEVNVSVLGTAAECEASVTEQPLSAEEILSFDEKYLRGGKGGKYGIKGPSQAEAGMASLDRRIPAPIDKNQESRIKKLALDVFKACGCAGVARVDFLIDKKSDDVYVTEINTIPGSLSFYLWEASGVSFQDLLNRLVTIAGKVHAEKHILSRHFESTLLK